MEPIKYSITIEGNDGSRTQLHGVEIDKVIWFLKRMKEREIKEQKKDPRQLLLEGVE